MLSTTQNPQRDFEGDKKMEENYTREKRLMTNVTPFGHRVRSTRPSHPDFGNRIRYKWTSVKPGESIYIDPEYGHDIGFIDAKLLKDDLKMAVDPDEAYALTQKGWSSEEILEYLGQPEVTRKLPASKVVAKPIVETKQFDDDLGPVKKKSRGKRKK